MQTYSNFPTFELLDDETPVVRENVVRALEAYGASLERALSHSRIEPEPRSSVIIIEGVS